ncbi:hypothetical protein PTSG_00616 [Salpingoeca rosetta]|uniref:Uncharacterized protein n=1 Tax=Salpingoeca rosetta (strain ATCC 50818 / BSB-021) TaxID=946362 RepID=F2TWZ8_SALR5|nr:uncharacterized protein PTSG_00616 [Salpingoeca rosetta]EGD75907.1 hypothetical protein PTSG_00616 [Salpingoeca rosetta]|eukprot:XP_004998083.1 hypothetical protein PTSG_00616 [Salpingoeca rosetta]
MGDSGVLRLTLDALLSKATAIQDELYKMRSTLKTSSPSCTLPLVVLVPGQIEVLMMSLRRREHPDLHNRVLVPKAMSTELDEHLQSVTSGVVSSFTHDKAPVLLRTKADPELEAELEDAYEESAEAAETGREKVPPAEALSALDHTCSRVLDFLNSQKKEVELRVRR